MSDLGAWLIVRRFSTEERRGFTLIELIIHLGDGQISRHAIQSMRSVQFGASWSYEVIYASVDGDMSFDFFVHPGGILQLKNPRDVVWRQPNG